MKIDLYHLPTEIPEGMLRSKTVIVIDVLRASSSIATAIHSGSRNIIPADSIAEASRLAQQVGRKSVLLCGERNGRKIDGFDLGNSPSEYKSEVVQDRIVVLATTNGSRAIVRTKPGALSLVASFLNASSVCHYSLKSEKDIVIVCSGKEGAFSLEDTVCGGLMISRLAQYAEGDSIDLDDAAIGAQILYERYADNILSMLQTSSHGRYLTEIGFEDDLAVCAQIDTLKVVPMLLEGRIVRAKAEQR